MLDELLLLAGNDIPFIPAQITIHVPTLKEIGYIGESNFYIGCELLNFSKDNLITVGKSNLGNQTNFEIFMSVMKSKDKSAREKKICAIQVLSLLFPEYKVLIQSDSIELKKDENSRFLNNRNFEEFQKILVEIFCLKARETELDYNPANALAAKFAEKMKAGRSKAATAKNEKQKINMLSRYISILVAGQKKNMNDYMSYTVYQLHDEFERFQLKMQFDLYVKSKLAGAKDVKEVEDWMKDIHS